MQGKSRIAAIGIVLGAGMALAIYLWASAGQARLFGYGFMRLDQGQLVVNFDRHLVWLDSRGRELSAKDLGAAGLHPAGDFDFFANGDLLVYHRAKPRSVWQNLRAFFSLREGPLRPDTTGPADLIRPDGFYRCALDPVRCQPLVDTEVLPARSSRFVIDRRRDLIYLADTSDHSLYKLSASGQPLASRREGFAFPNQLLLRGDELWLADTNHHRVVQIDTDTERFAEVLQTFEVAAGNSHRWPHQLAESDVGLWVLLGNHAMADGKLRFLSATGELSQPLGPAALAQAGLNDPLAIHFWQDALWVSDFSEPKLVRLHPGTGEVFDVQSETLATLEQGYRTEHERYHRFILLALLLFALVMVSGSIAAWRLEKDQTRRKLSAWTKPAEFDVGGEVTATGRADILWIRSGLATWHRRLPAVLWFCWVAIALLVLSLGFGEAGFSPSLLWLMFAMLVFLGVVNLMAQRILNSIVKSRLGVIGDSLVLVDAAGRRTVARGSNIRYSAQFLLADDVAVALGNQNLRFFAEDELKRWVYPRLGDAHKLSAREQWAALWRLRHPHVTSAAGILAAMLIFLLVLEYGVS